MKRLWILTLLFLAAIGVLWLQDSSAVPFTLPSVISHISDSDSGDSDSDKGSDTTSASDSLSASVWVATAYNIDYPSSPTSDADELKSECRSILSRAKKAGITTVYLQVRPACDAFYDSELFPWSEYLTGSSGSAPEEGFDPLRYWVKQAHKRGIRLEAWVNPYRICAGSNAESDFAALDSLSPAKQHPDWVVKYDGGYYFDPGIPEVRSYITKGIREIVEGYNVDGIQFDDYFYPGADFDDSETFSAYGGDFDSIDDWRRDNVNALVKSVYKTVHRHAKNSDCVFGISPSGIWKNGTGGSDGSATRGYEHYSECYADSITWIDNGWIDYICPQVYWEIGNDAADFQTIAEWWSDMADGTGVELRIGLAGYKVGSTENGSVWESDGVNELSRQIELCRDNKSISDVALFSYKDILNYKSIYKLFRKEF